MDSSKKISLGQIAKLMKGVSWQDGKLTFSFNEGDDVVANLQDFVDAQDFLTSAELAGYATEEWTVVALDTLEDKVDDKLTDKANTNDSRFHSHANKAALDSISSFDIAFWDDKAEKKNIRVVQANTNVVLSPVDDVVVMLSDYTGPNDMFTPSGTIVIPHPGDLPGKEFWLVNHDWYKKLVNAEMEEVLFYESGMGAATHRVQNAVHLKSDGVKWYQTNNYNGQHFGIIPQGGVTLPPIPQVVRYTGTQGAPLNLPDPQALAGRTIKIIFENGAVLNQPFIDLDGTSRPPSVETTAAGTVFEFTGGESWQKIN